MKTPLQELIEWMEQNQYFIGNDLYAKQKELLEKEREQIENAYKQGIVDEYGDTIDLRTITEAEQYFNETFNQNK